MSTFSLEKVEESLSAPGLQDILKTDVPVSFDKLDWQGNGIGSVLQGIDRAGKIGLEKMEKTLEVLDQLYMK